MRPWVGLFDCAFSPSNTATTRYTFYCGTSGQCQPNKQVCRSSYGQPHFRRTSQTSHPTPGERDKSLIPSGRRYPQHRPGAVSSIVAWRNGSRRCVGGASVPRPWTIPCSRLCPRRVPGSAVVIRKMTTMCPSTGAREGRLRKVKFRAVGTPVATCGRAGRTQHASCTVSLDGAVRARWA